MGWEWVIILDYRQLINRLNKAVRDANTRIRQLQQYNIMSPALYDHIKSGKPFSTIDIGNREFITGNEIRNIRNEYYRVSAFLKRTTSTIEGAENFKNELVSRLGVEIDYDMLWDVMEEAPVTQVLEMHYANYKGVRVQRRVAKIIKKAKAKGLQGNEFIEYISNELQRQSFRDVKRNRGANVWKEIADENNKHRR